MSKTEFHKRENKVKRIREKQRKRLVNLMEALVKDNYPVNELVSKYNRFFNYELSINKQGFCQFSGIITHIYYIFWENRMTVYTNL